VGSLALPCFDISFANRILYVTLSVLRDSTHTPREWVKDLHFDTTATRGFRSAPWYAPRSIFSFLV